MFLRSIPIVDADSLINKRFSAVPEGLRTRGGSYSFFFLEVMGDKSECSVEAFKEYTHDTILNFLLMFAQQQFVQVLLLVRVQVDRHWRGVESY